MTAAGAGLTGRAPLDEVDPELRALISDEKHRQVYGLELIASEVTERCLYMHSNFCPYIRHPPSFSFSRISRVGQ